MADFSAQIGQSTPLFLHTGSLPESAQAAMQTPQGGTGLPPAARTWVANLVSYCPMTLTKPYPCQRMVWQNGSTITSTNVDAGIYTFDGRRIYNTGSTVMSGANVPQYVTIGTPFVLAPGMYYFAWTCDNTTNRGMAFGGAILTGRFIGLLEETTGGFGLPATMTPTAWTRAWTASVVGVTRTTTGF